MSRITHTERVKAFKSRKRMIIFRMLPLYSKTTSLKALATCNQSRERAFHQFFRKIKKQNLVNLLI